MRFQSVLPFPGIGSPLSDHARSPKRTSPLESLSGLAEICMWQTAHSRSRPPRRGSPEGDDVLHKAVENHWCGLLSLVSAEGCSLPRPKPKASAGMMNLRPRIHRCACPAYAILLLVYLPGCSEIRLR